MIWFLRLAFCFVLVSMLCVTSWASLQCTLWETPRAVVLHPWFIATLFDTYFGFLTFYAWLAYKETSNVARGLWLVAILLLGNIAMAGYLLILLFRLPTHAAMEQILFAPIQNQVNLDVPLPEPTEPAKSFWRRRVLDVIVGQLQQGITPQKISLTLALGVTCGIFPILGATTLLCLGFGLWLKLNQPIIQMVNWLVSAAQLALILVFVRVGEFVVRAQPVSFSIPELFRKFNESPLEFMRQFGLTGVHGIIGWLLIAPGLIALLYFILLPLMQKLARASQK